MTKRVTKRNWPWSKRTYSAKRKTWTRPKGSPARGRSVSSRVHSTRIKASLKTPKAKLAKVSKPAKPTKMPALFGTPYEKLSPAQQALVRRAMNYQRRNPGAGSFERCVAAVSKRGGVDDPAAVCAASKMRTPKGKRELLAAARVGRSNPGRMCPMSATNPFAELKQGGRKAEIYQTGRHEFGVRIGAEHEQFKTYKAAQSWARMRLHELSNPKGLKVRVFPLRHGRKNPLDAAQKMSEDFHGFPSTEVMEFVEQVHYHSNLWSIGPLISMTIRNGNAEAVLSAPDPATSPIADVVFLSCTEDGRQMIPVGGDQKIPIDQLMGKFGLNQYDVRDHMLIGEIKSVTYRTRKIFEADGREEIDFFHDLGEDHSDGVLPILIFKPRNPSMEIAGGRYFIGKVEKALGASPGIVG